MSDEPFFDYDACTVDALNRALDERLRTQAAEIERLRAALEEIAGLGVVCASDIAAIVLRKNIARSALEDK